MNSKESLQGFCLTISREFFSFYKNLPFLYFIYFYSLFHTTGHLNTHYSFQSCLYWIPGCANQWVSVSMSIFVAFLGLFSSCLFTYYSNVCILTCYILFYSFLHYFLIARCFLMRKEKVNQDQIRGRKELGREEGGETVIEIPCMKIIHFY